jgi:hypothetical protein
MTSFSILDFAVPESEESIVSMLDEQMDPQLRNGIFLAQAKAERA